MKTTGQEFFAARPGSRIAAPQFDIPEERRIRFHTEQWVIGSLARDSADCSQLQRLLGDQRTGPLCYPDRR